MIKIRKLKMSSAFCVIFSMGLIYSFNTIYCAQNLLNVYIVSSLMCFITIVFSLISRKEYRYNKDKLVLNKIAARWPAKAVAQFYFY